MIGQQGNARTDGQTTDEARPDPYVGNDVAAVLVEQLRSDEVTPGQRATLREELGIATPESMQVRLDYLQSQVSEIAAYTDALEAFLDEQGGAEQALSALRENLDRTNERLDHLETRFDAAAEERATLATRLDEVSAELDALDGAPTDAASTDCVRGDDADPAGGEGDDADSAGDEGDTRTEEDFGSVAESIQEAERGYEEAE